MNTSDENREVLEELAAEWVVRRDAGFSSDDLAQFQHWLASDPRHALVFSEMEAALRAVARPREMGEAVVVLDELADWEHSRRRRQRRRNVVAFATMSLAAAAAVVVAFVLPAQRPPISLVVAAAGTVAARHERQTLADGSIVELKPGAEIQVHFTSEKRAVRLLHGAAHFAVAKDLARPFVVTAGALEVRAVGTEFVVQYAAKQIDVIVTEGRVAVVQTSALPVAGTAAPTSSEPVPVDAGMKVTLPTEATSAVLLHVAKVTPAEIESALAWRGMRLEFTGTPLAEAVALFNRKSQVQVSLIDPTLAGLRVSGIYWADNPEGFATLIETSLDLKAVRETPGRIVLRRR